MGNMVVMQFEAAKWALHTNVEGVSHEDSLISPEPGGNSLNWVVGHLVTAYNNLLPAVGGEKVWSDDQAAVYGRGSDPIDAERAMPFDRILADFDRAHGQLVEKLSGLSENELAAPAPYSPLNNPEETLGSLAHLTAFHQAYHAGQAGILRRIVGRAGAIQ